MIIFLIGVIFAIAGSCLIVLGCTEQSHESVKAGLIGGVVALTIGLFCIINGIQQDILQDQLDGKLPYVIGKIVQWRDGTTQTIPMNDSVIHYRKDK